VSFTVIDNESEISSQTGCEATLVSEDTAGVTFTCSATSAGGSDSVSVSVKRDATAPAVSMDDVQNFYYGFPPAVAPTVSASDNLSGLASATLSGYDATRGPGVYGLTANAPIWLATWLLQTPPTRSWPGRSRASTSRSTWEAC
jgi:hypothetical protein